MRSAVVFVLVLAIFSLVEILPLHFGPRQLPWPEVIEEVRGRLPRILLIAVAVSVFMSVRRKGGNGEDNQSN